MQVFITGGSGLIGTAVVSELLAHGHSVLALARSDTSAQALVSAGAQALRGAITDLDVVRSGATQADGVIHLAFGNDFSSAEAITRAVTEESAALEAIGAELTGSNRPFVTVAGTPWIPGRLSTEADRIAIEGPFGGRFRSVEAVLGLASRGVRSSAVRMPRTVHNQGRGGFASLLTDIARKSGVSGYPQDGMQRWPAVHALDAAVLFRLALETAPAGTAWHAVADEGDRVLDIATVIGRQLGLPVKPVQEDHFGALGPVFSMDQPSSSRRTQEVLGWKPVHPSLLSDLEHLKA